LEKARWFTYLNLHLHLYLNYILTLTYFYTFEGIDNNETIKVYKSGGADPEGDRPGDLYVTVKVKNLIFS
jgi:hypothetical protein